MHPTTPEIAVVIPTWRRESRLAFALAALSEQTLGCDRFEVIVVRPVSARAEPLTVPPAALSIRCLWSERKGTAVQRNLGWRAATAQIVAFTDDDCRPAPGWLEALLASTVEGRIVQGRTEPDPDEAHLLHGLARTIRNEHESGWYETCNIAYPRSLLQRTGGFDERIDFLGEDADLGARSVAGGARLEFSDAALVWHAVHWRSLPAALRDACRRGSRPAIVARNPALRKSLWLGLFADRDHAFTLLAVAGLALGSRTAGMSVLALAPYLERRVDRSRLTPWGLARMPTQLGARALVDVVEAGAFLLSSVRNRTLVL